MAQRVQVTLVCDLHGDETPGSVTVPFSLDGSAYEIDLCDDHAAQLRDAFAPYVGAARRSGSRPAGAGRGGRRRRSAGGSDVDAGAVRAWARENGVTVSERGRISREVLDQYAAATG
jgi:hypothetical protein